MALGNNQCSTNNVPDREKKKNRKSEMESLIMMVSAQTRNFELNVTKSMNQIRFQDPSVTSFLDTRCSIRSLQPSNDQSFLETIFKPPAVSLPLFAFVSLTLTPYTKGGKNRRSLRIHESLFEYRHLHNIWYLGSRNDAAAS